MLKDHPYRKIAQAISIERRNQPNFTLQILGLSASLTYSVVRNDVSKAISALNSELHITTMCTASLDELQSSGYHGSVVEAEVEEIPIEEKTRSDVVPPALRKPHLMSNTFFTRYDRGESTAFSVLIMTVILAIERAIASRDSAFRSPIRTSSLKLWGKYAHDTMSKRGQYIYNENIHILCTMYQTLEHWYEALKILVVSWEEDEDICVLFLEMMGCRLDYNTTLTTTVTSATSISSPTYNSSTSIGNHTGSMSTMSTNNSSSSIGYNTTTTSSASVSSTPASVCIWPAAVVDAMAPVWSYLNNVYPKFDRLRRVMLEKDLALEYFRGIIFVQQRVTTHIISHFIQTDPQLRERFRSAPLYATSSAATASLSLSPTQSRATIAAFANGEINVLVCTVVAEEGMDIPSANVVIRFDPMINSVSMVQGRGRARQEDSRFVVLSERADRPVTRLVEVEQQQQRIVESFSSKFLPTTNNSQALVTAQLGRERSARDTLLRSTTSSELFAQVKIYEQKTKGRVDDVTRRSWDTSQ